MTDTFDFGDGPVPAHRHINPDGSLGGWVSDDTTIDGTCWVSDDSLVFGYSEVLFGSKITDKSTVREGIVHCSQVTEGSRVSNSAVHDGSVITGESQVSEFAHIEGGSIISDGSVVTKFSKVSGGSVVHKSLVSQSEIQQGSCVSGGSRVEDHSVITGGSSVVGSVVSQRSVVSGRSLVYNSTVKDSSSIQDGSKVWGDSVVGNRSRVCCGAAVAYTTLDDSGVFEGAVVTKSVLKHTKLSRGVEIEETSMVDGRKQHASCG